MTSVTRCLMSASNRANVESFSTKCKKYAEKFGGLKYWHYFCSVKNTQRTV